jgi:hypothetical protein
MSEHANQSPEPNEPGLTRREFIGRLGMGIGAALLTTTTLSGIAYRGYELWEDREGRDDAEAMFQDILFHKHKFAIYEGLVQIDPNAVVSTTLFGESDTELDIPEGDDFLVAIQPIAVYQTLLDNIADHNQDTRSRVGRALPALADVLAFYQPGPGSMVYMHVNQSNGYILPLNTSPDSDGDFISTSNTYNDVGTNQLPIGSVDIAGRAIHDGVAYPYTTAPTWLGDNAEIAGYIDQVIGHSLFVADGADLDHMVNRFNNSGAEPISLPSPPRAIVRGSAPAVNLQSNPFSAPSLLH